ncbi:hypothetical protein [Nocardia salmonicida]|uniref:hypothetical protein n=1 Tax=Nocardia salmonicida TaxID=53431 RepID=UPI0033FF6C89
MRGRSKELTTRGRRTRCLATAVTVAAALGVGPVGTAQAGAPSCADGWHAEVLAADLGGLENLEYDEFTLAWSPVARPNGLALAPDHLAVITEDVLTSQLLRVPLDAPDRPTPLATVNDGLLPALDDLDVTAAGLAFVTGDYSGSVYQVDPTTGAWCTLATGWTTPRGPLPTPPPIGPTSARLAPDSTTGAWSLYVTSIDGTLRRLRPPATLDLTPSFVR